MHLLKAISNLENIGTQQCQEWRESKLRRHPAISHYLAAAYKRLAKDQDYIAANQWLGNVSKRLKLGKTGLYLDSSEEELNDYCKAKARKTELEIKETVDLVGKDLAPLMLKKHIEYAGVSLPLPDDYKREQVVPALARACDAKWWKRQLRDKQWREMEAFLREEGFTHKQREIYCSDLSVQRRLGQKKKNRQLLEKMEAENEEGQTYRLSELADLSPSNPIIRRNELMVRLRGFEDFAEYTPEDYQGIFYTLTCPSKYHARYQHGGANPKYNGSTPLEAHDHLNKVWQRTRAAWKRSSIECFGMRVVEPHHDGTPHWHLLLFIQQEQIELASTIFRKYALAEDGTEKGASERRFTAVNIDKERGSATGYVAKYIAKNIDGYNVETDHYGRNAIDSAVRIEAWASIWNIRQFQQIGGASVTVWRELRRLEEAGEEKLLAELITAADNGDWAKYTELMGGAVCLRKDRPLRPMLIERTEQSRYGEIVKRLQGLWYGLQGITTRLHEWTIRINQNSAAEDLSTDLDGIGFGVGLSQAPPSGGVTLEFCQ